MFINIYQMYIKFMYMSLINADCYYLKLVCLRQRLRNDELSQC